jgi:hypothetical protein
MLDKNVYCVNDDVVFMTKKKIIKKNKVKSLKDKYVLREIHAHKKQHKNESLDDVSEKKHKEIE